MSVIRVYIVEDEPLIAETIRISLEKEEMEVVGMADNIGEAYFQIDELMPDLIFLDITLDDRQDGLKLGKKINDKLHIPFIYLTSHSDNDTVKQAAETNPAGYILKPFKSKDLKVAVDFALMETQPEIKESASDFLFVKHKKKWIKLNVSDILVAKADDVYTEIHTRTERFVLSQPLKKIEEKLDSTKFKRAQRSFVVNIDAITAIEDDVLVIDKHLVPIGKTYRKELLDSLNFL